VTLTPTPTETTAPLDPAQLFPIRDREGRTIDWGYQRISEVRRDPETNQVVGLSAFLSFRLLDRAIHRETVQVLGKPLTVYYLNTSHEFGTLADAGREAVRTEPVKLVLSGEWGRDVPLASLTNPGSFFVTTLLVPYQTGFDPYRVHLDANRDLPDRKPEYRDLFLVELERLLAELPDPLILVAEGPILVDPAGYGELSFSIQNVPYLTARYLPLVTLDEEGEVISPSSPAVTLANTLLKGGPLLEAPESFSNSVLVLIQGPEG